MIQLDLRKRQILLVIIYLLLLTTFLWLRFAPTRIIDVEVAKISRGNIEAQVSAPGIVVPANIDVVVAKSDGVIQDLRAYEGMKVKNGEILGIIGNPEIKMKILETQVDLSLAEEDLKKVEEPEKQAAAQNRYKLARDNLKFLKGLREISSKVNGEVIDLKIKNGQGVVKGTELFKVGDLSQMELKAKVSEYETSNIKKGQKATIGETMYKDIEFNGYINKISKLIERQMGTSFMEITVTIASKEGYPLKLGSYAEARIVTSKEANVLLVPKEALLVGEGNVTKVFTLKGRKANLQTITTGISSEDYAEVLSGLSEGDEVVTKGKFDLKGGSRVKIRRTI